MATVAENLQTIIDIKADIKTAIENKGVTVGDAGFGEYAGKIDEISGGGGDIILPSGFRIGYSGADNKYVNNGFTWPSNLKFAKTNSWPWAFYSVKNVTGLPAIETVADDLYYKTDFYSMFSYAKLDYDSNKTFFDSLDFSNVIDMGDMFYNSDITGFTEYSLIVTSPYITTISYLFYGAGGDFNYIPQIIEFSDCSKITTVFRSFNFNNVTDIVSLRLPNIGQGFSGTSSTSHKLDLQKVKFTTKQACLDLMNDLYDMNQTSVTDATIVLKQTHFDNLSDEEKAIVTNKGWILESA